MKQLLVQIQPERNSGFDEAAHCEIIERFGQQSPVVKELSVSSGDDSGRYVNLLFDTSDVAALWDSLRTEVLEADGTETQLAAVTIVTCHGKCGWDDYLLLHHFDKQVKLDRMG